MAEPLSRLPDPKAEMNPVFNQLRCEVEERKERFLEVKEKFLISEATVFSLARELQKYKCQKYKGIIESVLGEKFQPKEEEPADKLSLAEKLRESNAQIQDQAQQLCQLRHKLRQGRDASFLLSQHLKYLLTQDDPDSHRGQSLRDQLTEGCRLAEQLVHKLSPECEIYQVITESVPWEKFQPEDEELADELTLAEELRDLPKDGEMDEELTYSLEEMDLCNSSCPDVSRSLQPTISPDFLWEEHLVGSVLDVAENRTDYDYKDEERQETKASRGLQEEDEANEELMDSLDEKYLLHSSRHDVCVSPQGLSALDFLYEEHLLSSALDVAESKTNCEVEGRQDLKPFRLSKEGPEKDKIIEAQQISVEVAHKTSSSVCDICQSPCSSADLLNEHEADPSSEAVFPSSASSTRRNTMEECVSTLPEQKGAENYLLVDRFLSQLEENTDKFHDVKEKLQILEAKVLSLFSEPQKTKCETYQSITESVAGEKIQPEEEELADKLTLPEELRDLPEDGELEEELTDSLEMYLTNSSCLDVSGSLKPTVSPDSVCEEHLVGSSLDVAENKSVCEDEKTQQATMPRKYCELIGERIGELTQLRQHLREGRTASFAFSQHLKDLLNQDIPDRHREPLAEGLWLAERLIHKLNAEHQENKKFEEKELLSPMNDKDREFHFLLEVQAGELTQLNQKLQEGREGSSYLQQLLKDLLSQDEPDSLMGQDHRKKLAEGHRLAECFAYKLSPENLEDKATDEVEESLESLDPRKYYDLIHEQIRKLTRLRQQLREGRDALSSLNQHLEDLLNQDIPDSLRQELAEGQWLAKRLVPRLQADHCENKRNEEKEQFLQINDEDREFHFLMEVQARELSQLRHKLQEGRDASSYLRLLLKDLLTQDGPDSLMGQDHRENLAEGHRLAECLAHKLSPENLGNEESDEEVVILESLIPRKCYDLIHEQIQELTHLHQKLREGKEASSSLSQHFKDFLKQDIPEIHQEQLAEVQWLAERLVHKLHADHYENKEYEEKEPLSQWNDEGREFSFLSEVQAQELTQLWQKLQEGRDAASSLEQILQHLLTQDGPDSLQQQDLREKLAEGHRLAERVVDKLSPEYLGAEDDDEEEEFLESLAPRKRSDVIYEQTQELLQQLQQKLQQGKDATSSFIQHLEDLPNQGIPDSHRRELAEEQWLAERLVPKLHADRCENKEYEEKEPLSQVKDEDRDFRFLIHVQARDLTQLRQKLKAERESSSFLKKLLKDLLTQDGPDSLLRQDHGEKIAQRHRLAECLAHKLSSEHIEEDDAEEFLETLATRESDFLVQHQARELTRLRQKLREGRDASFSLHKQLKDLLTEDSDQPQGKGRREQLAEAHRLAERLMQKLGEGEGATSLDAPECCKV